MACDMRTWKLGNTYFFGIRRAVAFTQLTKNQSYVYTKTDQYTKYNKRQLSQSDHASAHAVDFGSKFIGM